jgi:four helix bundle suffix protein
VARASLEELRLDYEDFLRQRRLPIWNREDPRRASLIARRCSTADDIALWAKAVHDGQHGQNGRHGRNLASTGSTSSTPSTTYPEIAANAALILIAVACSLLDRQIAAQSDAFEKEGGFSERMYRVRSARRKR